MSENLDLPRSIFAAWERGDFSSIAWARSVISNTCWSADRPDRSTGLAGMVASWRSRRCRRRTWRSSSQPKETISLVDRLARLEHRDELGQPPRARLGPLGVVEPVEDRVAILTAEPVEECLGLRARVELAP